MNLGVLLFLACAASGPGNEEGVSTPCHLLTKVRVIPFKGERVDDAAYNSLKADRLRAIPCLVEKLTDVTPMRDPRKAPPYSGLKVGDVAFFLLADFACAPFDEVFPEDLKRRYAEDGIDAYFRFVEIPTNRRLLQERWRARLDKAPNDPCLSEPKGQAP
jgi:hypothetical protein